MREDLLTALKRYGFATVAAVVLGYLYIVEVRADQEKIVQRLDVQTQHLIAIVEEQGNLARGVLKVADKNGETQMLQEKILAVMRAMCIQGAVTAQEKRECLREQ